MKLSIITINRNNAIGLEQTIKSVISLKYSNFEYIVIDGASTDNSIDIIRKYASSITFWISEPDKGIYNAMNKTEGVYQRVRTHFARLHIRILIPMLSYFGYYNTLFN